MSNPVDVEFQAWRLSISGFFRHSYGKRKAFAGLERFAAGNAVDEIARPVGGPEGQQHIGNAVRVIAFGEAGKLYVAGSDARVAMWSFRMEDSLEE